MRSLLRPPFGIAFKETNRRPNKLAQLFADELRRPGDDISCLQARWSRSDRGQFNMLVG
jgi:hypothetical protein